MADYTIRVEGVNKTFSIRERNNDSIRQRLFDLFRDKNTKREIKALTNINITLKKGELLGLIGHNGSGKSTLLRIILGAINPDEGGIVETHGKILRLSLGIGFDPNLSARHNIYVNGSIMGLTFKEIGQRFHDILKFAELEDYVDTPIKFFSSGMYSRLAFSIAMHAKADILLIDEFFGTVGDEAFRMKSNDYFTGHMIKDKTVIFVSHNLELVAQYCDKVLVLEKGKIIAQGNPKDIVDQYKESFSS